MCDVLTFGEAHLTSRWFLIVMGGIAYLAVIRTERRMLHYLPARRRRNS